MPIIDLQAQQLGDALDTPKGFAVTPGEEEVNKGSEAPSWSSTLGAAFRQDNTVGSFFFMGNPSQIRDDTFNPWDEIKGSKYEQHFSSFADVRNRHAFETIKAKIDQEEEDRKLLSSAPWYQSLLSQGAAGAIDLPTLIPGGAFVKGAKGGFSMARSALSVGGAAGVSSALQETALQNMQETRTAGESAINIGASVLLGGLLGAGGAKLLSPAEWASSVAKLEADVATGAADIERGFSGSPVSAGAAANLPASLEENAIAGRAASAVASSTAQMNPALRALTSPSAAYREEATKLFENALYLKKNSEGIASEPAVETLMKEWNAGLASAVRNTEGAFSDYVKASGGGKLAEMTPGRFGLMTRSEFREEVGRAMRRGDTSDNPHVAKVAQEWRAKVFDPLKDAAIDAKLLPADVSVETAQSYFSRMWNRQRLVAQEGRFKGIVSEWVENQMPVWRIIFDKETAEQSAKLKDEKLAEYLRERRIEREARFDDVKDAGRQVADEVFNSLTGRTSEGPRPEFITIKARGPLKERTFNIPDELVEDFLESDVDVVGRRYARVMGADVELARKFGSVDMKDQIAKIREDYKQLRERTTTEKERIALDKREKSDIGDLESMRDMLRGTDPGSPADQNYARIVRSVNHLNYLRSMGEVAFASLAETVRPAMVHGLRSYMETIGQLATNLKGIKMSVAEAQLAGNVVERALGHRLATLSDIADPYASRGPVEAFLENMTNVGSRWNGIRLLTDMQKSISAVMSQNRVLQGVEGYSKIAPDEKRFLAYVGIDQGMAERIAKQFAEHGETVEKVRVANTEKWTDEVARRTYRATINKDVDSIITTKGVADTPLFANTPTGRAMLQFKSFALASHQRVLLRGLQEKQSRFVGGLLAMSMIGMFATWLKAISGNRMEKLQDIGKNPGWWISEGLDRSGVFSVPVELANTFEKATGLNPIKTPLRAFDEGSAQSQRMQNRSLMGSIAGPSAGLVDDASSVLGIPRKIMQDEEVTRGQKNAAERLVPFNSYFGIRQILRYAINPDAARL